MVTAEPSTPWHPGRCAALHLADGTLVGHAGELHPRVVKALALPERTCAMELDLDRVVAAARRSLRPRRSPPSRWPPRTSRWSSTRPPRPTWRRRCARAAELLESLRLFDVFTGPQIGEGQRRSPTAALPRADRTLTVEEATAARRGRGAGGPPGRGGPAHLSRTRRGWAPRVTVIEAMSAPDHRRPGSTASAVSGGAAAPCRSSAGPAGPHGPVGPARAGTSHLPGRLACRP